MKSTRLWAFLTEFTGARRQVIPISGTRLRLCLLEFADGRLFGVQIAGAPHLVADPLAEAAAVVAGVEAVAAEEEGAGAKSVQRAAHEHLLVIHQSSP